MPKDKLERRELRVTSTKGTKGTKARTNQQVNQRQLDSGRLTTRPTSEGLDTFGNAWRACFEIDNKQNSHAAHIVVSRVGVGGVRNRERKELRDGRSCRYFESGHGGHGA